MSEFRFTVTVGETVEKQIPFAPSPSIGIAVLSALGLSEEILLIDPDDETNTPSIEIDPMVFEHARVDGVTLNGRSLPGASLWAVNAARLALNAHGPEACVSIDVAPRFISATPVLRTAMAPTPIAA